MERYDAVVIGGGPAGLAAAIAAARAGLSVLLADARKPPIDKLCGEGILPDGLAALLELGVPLPAAATGGVPFEGISFHEGASAVEARFPGPAATRHTGFGLRRTALHAVLMAAAEREGVTLRWQARAQMERLRAVRVGGDTIHCRYVLGADGQRSLVRGTAGLGAPSTPLRHQRLAGGRHYGCAHWSPLVEVHWAGRTQAYVTPVGENEVGVAFISADSAIRPDACLHLFPALQARLAGAAVCGRTQGGVSTTLRIPRVVYAPPCHEARAGGVALVGEASGGVDAITGDGLSLLFRQAVALGSALRAGDLEQYQREHRRIFRRARFLSRGLLTLSEHPAWRSRVFRAFADEPLAFENLLGVHVGEWPRLFGAGGCTRLCGQLLFGKPVFSK